MDIMLFIASLVVLGLALCVLAFAAVGRAPGPTVGSWHAVVSEPISRFFVQRPEPAPHPVDPLDAVLLQIERHVRLEQAAGESFLFSPTIESLQIKTTSSLGR